MCIRDSFITDQDNFHLDKRQKAFLKHKTFHGNEIVANTRRLCLMNLFLHNIGEIDGGAPISPNDSLVADDGERYDYVLANPPFGRKSALSFTNEEGEQETDDLTYNRQDFWATTSNKQLNFVQHIRTMLKTSGRAARHQRTATWDQNEAPEGRWRSYDYEEIIAHDKTSLDLFWLKDQSLTDLDDLPEPEDLAAEIIDNLEAGLESFRKVLNGLGQR